tara:strand:+ start:77 stop:283 length:207 start_codon:yes stop_codon:yes gene_type:complete
MAKNVITYTDEYFELVDMVLDLDIDNDTRGKLATQMFKAIAAAETVGYEGSNALHNGNVRGMGKLVES